MKIIEKLSTYAALIGVISGIGSGFYVWGQFNTRLDALESQPPVNLQPLMGKDKELTTEINNNKIDLIDRIKKVEDKIQPVDLTSVFKEIGKVREQVAMINIPDAIDLTPVLSSIKDLEKLVAEANKEIAIALKENQIQDAKIEEIKIQTSNPLSN